MVSQVRVEAAWAFATLFQSAREGLIATLDLTQLDGIITFPSFHAATAVLLAWAFWSSTILRWPVSILNALMWMSAVPIGGHYVIDVMAGTAIALGALGTTVGWERMQGSLRSEHRWSFVLKRSVVHPISANPFVARRQVLPERTERSSGVVC